VVNSTVGPFCVTRVFEFRGAGDYGLRFRSAGRDRGGRWAAVAAIGGPGFNFADQQRVAGAVCECREIESCNADKIFRPRVVSAS